MSQVEDAAVAMAIMDRALAILIPEYSFELMKANQKLRVSAPTCPIKFK